MTFASWARRPLTFLAPADSADGTRTKAEAEASFPAALSPADPACDHEGVAFRERVDNIC